jgi:hypothetical protein
VTKFLLLVNYDGGLPGTPMPSWGPADIKANLAYYDALNQSSPPPANRYRPTYWRLLRPPRSSVPTGGARRW